MTDHAKHVSRRSALKISGLAALSGVMAELVSTGGGASVAAAAPAPKAPGPIKLPNLFAPTERESQEMPAPLPWDQRVGFAIVGLGRLSLDQILPAFAKSKRCRPVALVSGDRAKASIVASQYGIDSKSLYDYKNYDRLRDDRAVDVVYVVLPNSMHAEYTVRAAQAGKHVLCEKPMANSVTECQQMIDACNQAGKKLMIAYRMQYEPHNREVIRMARAGELGTLKGFSATNGQAQGDPRQWRLSRALAGGGALPDVGIYCLNAARYLTGEEPTEVSALMGSTPGDPRFTEVEEQVEFLLRFPSGVLASCSTSYGYHNSKRFRLLGSAAWADLDPAFPYTGQLLRIGRHRPGSPSIEIEQRVLEPKDHFAQEMDHLAMCVHSNVRPHTPGEEGMQDMRIIAALYESARGGHPVKIQALANPASLRGPAPVPA
jgi:predicted dehydrogenase